MFKDFTRHQDVADASIDYQDYNRYFYHFTTDTPLCMARIFELFEYDGSSETYADWTEVPYYVDDSTYANGLQLYDGT